MKTLLKYLLVLIIGLAIGAFIFKSCYKPEVQDNSQRIRELTSERDSLNKEVKALLLANDSLSTIKQKIKTQIVFREREIDENIASGISTPIGEYRRSLQDNNWLPDETEFLSPREITFGAKGLARLPKLQLQINICEEQSFNKDKIIADKDFIITGDKELLNIQKLETEKWKDLYKDESAWYHEDWIWFGAGVITTTAIIFLSGIAK